MKIQIGRNLSRRYSNECNLINRPVSAIFHRKENRDTEYEDLREPSLKDGSGRVNDNQNHHISV